MTSPFESTIIWRKSSHSGTNGSQCVEVAAWRRSSHSGSKGQECVEVATWQKSSHSGTQGDACVEVARAERRVLVRDSKHPEGGVLAFGAATWDVFRARLGR